MSTSEFHEATFRWPYPASDVIVTGSFDGWSRTIHLPRTQSGYFQGLVQVPWGEKITYKYIVDGRWTTTDNQPTELDPMGNINNVYTSPARPFASRSSTPKATEPKLSPETEKPQTVGQVNGILGTAKVTATQIIEAIAPGTTELGEDTPAQTPTPVPEKVEEPKPTEKTVEPPQPAPEATPAETPVPEPSVPTPAQEVEPEVVLPSTVKPADVLPVVPVPLVPLAHEAPPVNADGKAVEETPAAESTPATAATDSEVKPPAEASTHTPVKANGKTVPPADVALPPGTPKEVPLPDTPPANGSTKPTDKKPASTSSTSSPAPPTPTTPTTPTPTPHKEKRAGFPTFGRKHRHSSSSHSAVSEQGESPTNSPGKESNSSVKGSTRRKNRKSFFGKIMDVFHHDDHHHKEETK